MQPSSRAVRSPIGRWDGWLATLAVVSVYAAAGQAQAVRMSRPELIQASSLVFVGVVLDQQSRWNDSGNLIVTDYRFRVDEVLLGSAPRELTLTFAGGQLPDEGQAVPGVPEFEVGDIVLLMVEESEIPLLSSVTGLYQGKFTASAVDGTRPAGVLNGLGAPLTDDEGGAMTFEDFVALIRTEIHHATPAR